MYVPMINRVKSALAYECNENTIAEIKAIVGIEEVNLIENDTTIDAEITSIDLLILRLGKLAQKYKLYDWANVCFALLYKYDFDNDLNLGIKDNEVKIDAIDCKTKCTIGCAINYDDKDENFFDLAILKIGDEELRIPMPMLNWQIQLDIYRISAINGSIEKREFADQTDSISNSMSDSIESLIESVLFSIYEIDYNLCSIYNDADGIAERIWIKKFMK